MKCNNKQEGEFLLCLIRYRAHIGNRTRRRRLNSLIIFLTETLHVAEPRGTGTDVIVSTLHITYEYECLTKLLDSLCSTHFTDYFTDFGKKPHTYSAFHLQTKGPAQKSQRLERDKYDAICMLDVMPFHDNGISSKTRSSKNTVAWQYLTFRVNAPRNYGRRDFIYVHKQPRWSMRKCFIDCSRAAANQI